MSSSQLEIIIDSVTAVGRTYPFKETIKVEGEDPEVITAYFAEKKIGYDEKTHEDPFTFKFADDDNDLPNDAKRRKLASYIYGKLKADGDKKYTTNTKVYDALTKTSYKTDDEITIATYKKEKKEYYKKITTAPMGYQVYLVTETKKLDGKTLKIKILESKSQNQKKENILKLVKAETDSLPVLVFAKLEDKTTTTEAGDWIKIDIKKQDQKILGKTEGTEIEVGIKKIQLRPKQDKMTSETEDAIKSFEGWQEALFIRDNETKEGKEAIEAAKTLADSRKSETFTPLTRDADADKKENKKSFPKKVSGPENIGILGKDAVFTIDTYGTTATTEDKNNILWCIYVDSKKTIIDAKTKANLYTYAKVELTDVVETTAGDGTVTKTGGTNKLTIVFDKALKYKKIQIEPYRGKPDHKAEKEWVYENTVSGFKIKKRNKAHLYIKTQCDSVENAGETIDNEFLNSAAFKLETPNTIHIYEDGKMSKLNLDGLKKVKYRYHDANGDKHNICECEIFEIDERLKGVSNDKTSAHTVEAGYDVNSIITYSHASDRKKYTYPDGTIRTYGKFHNPDKGTNYRLVTYKKGSTKKLLVKMPDSLNKKIVTKSIIYSFTKTARRYCGPEHLAAFIGALADNGFTIKSGGACEEDGTSYPSVSHINGQSVDTSYLSSNTHEQNFINAMHKFGFGSQLRGSGKKVFTNTSNGGKLHNNHLHSGGLTPNYK